MTKCRTPELQDLLPDFVAESLGDADRVRVTAHLAECDACTADLAILRDVRAARVAVAPIDVARIVAALPRPAAATPVLQVHRGTAVPPSVRGASTAPSRSGSRSRWQGPQVWRMAATLGVILAGGFSVLVARRGGAAFDAAPDALQVVESTTVAPLSPTAAAPSESASLARPAATGTTTSAASPAASSPAHANVAVSYGALDNATEAEIQALIDRLEKWDGATSAEPAPTVPVVSSRGGAQP
ncbi:MAG: zf-HC2 domain-containing protein [Gemmatimonadaceae bacterium]|nr:zf-HC2 domain-containing protein [Gemmatimonadaceae bacterium]